MKWNISEIAMTSCRLVDQSSILAGAGINLFWSVSWTYPLNSTEVHLGKIYESASNIAPPASAKAETAWSISPTHLRDLLLKHITILLCSNLWNCVVTPCGPVHAYYHTAWLTCLFLHDRLAYCYNTLFLQKKKTPERPHNNLNQNTQYGCPSPFKHQISHTLL